MPKYKKKPIVIEAEQLTWSNWDNICDFVKLPWGPEGVRGVYTKDGVQTDEGENMGLIIPTLEGEMLAIENDYIIKGINGEYYPCKPDIFHKTYDIIKD